MEEKQLTMMPHFAKALAKEYVEAAARYSHGADHGIPASIKDGLDALAKISTVVSALSPSDLEVFHSALELEKKVYDDLLLEREKETSALVSAFREMMKK